LREQLPDAAPTILAALASIAASDEDLSEAELEVLAEVASDLGLASVETERILDAVFRLAEPATAAPVPPQLAARPSLDPQLDRALLVLGLDTLARRADLDQSYRRLIERYDPAKVIDLGPDFAAVAVRKLAEVTDAYRLAVEALQSQD
jgi:DnaJ-domain-containing protein 1